MTVNERIKILISELANGSQTDFSEKTGIPTTTVSSYLPGGARVSSPSIDKLSLIRKAYPQLRIEWLIDGEDPMLKPSAPSMQLIKSKPKNDIIVVTQDTHGNTTIPIINQKAAANYLAGYQSQEFFEQLEYMTMPHFMIGDGQNAVFQVTGDSMEPAFFDGEYVLCTKMEPTEWADLSDSNVVVVLSERYGTQLKRVKVRLKDKGFVRFKSDNKRHRDFTLPGPDILQMWVFKWKISPYAQNRAEELYKKVDNMEDTLDDQRTIIEQLLEEFNVLKRSIKK